MARNERNFFFFSKSVTDISILVISFLLAAFLAESQQRYQVDSTDVGFIVFLLVGWYFTARSNRLYADRLQENQIRELFKTVSNALWQSLLAIIFIFLIKEKAYSRTFVLLYTALLLLLLPIGKIVLKQVYLYLYRKGQLRKRAMIIGRGEVSQLFCRYLREHKHHGYQLVRYIPGEVSVASNATSGYKGRGLLVNGQPIKDLHQVDEIFISEDHGASYSTKEVASILSSFAVRLRILPNMYNMFSGGRYSFSIMGGFPLLSYRSEPLEDVYNRLVKRLFDIVFSVAVMLLVFSWLFPIIAIAIKLDSPGPIFYRQERWGKRNRPFWCLKFRSMYVQTPAYAQNGRFQQAQKNDPRITKVGRILRKTSFDEFPQFLNVFRGEMSVVGPRPHASLMNEESIQLIKNYMVRHQAKPGITGWAQVNGLRGESQDPKLLKARIQHDIWYIENWNFMLDLKIILLTFWRMVIGDKQAY